MELFCGDNAEADAINLISKKYKHFKVLILVHAESLKNYIQIVNNVKECVKEVNILPITFGLHELNTVSAIIKNSITEDVGLIINFCDEFVLKCATMVCGKVKIINYLTEPNISVAMLKPNYLVVSNALINKCTNKNLANCYGKICSLLFYLMEQVFNKAVFETDVNNSELLAIEQCLQNLLLIPAIVLKSDVGKQILTKVCLKLCDVITESNYQNSFVYVLSKMLIKTNKYKGLTAGESLIISSTLSFKMFNVLISAGMLTSEVGFNSFIRMNNIKQDLKTFSLSEVAKSFMCDADLQAHINNFFKIKTSFKTVFSLYFEMFNKMLNVFKGLYFDRAVCLNKFLLEQNLIKAVNLVSEQFNNASFATFVRDCGLLNKFNI